MKSVQIEGYKAFDGKVFTGESAKSKCEAYECNCLDTLYKEIKSFGITFYDCYLHLTWDFWTRMKKVLRIWSNDAPSNTVDKYFHYAPACSSDESVIKRYNFRFIWIARSEKDTVMIYDYIKARIGDWHDIPTEPFNIIGEPVAFLIGERHYETAWITGLEEIVKDIQENINSVIDPISEFLGSSFTKIGGSE